MIKICLELYGMDSKNISLPTINLFILDNLYHELVHVKQFDVIYKRIFKFIKSTYFYIIMLLYVNIILLLTT